VTVPATRSGFVARPAVVYVPPAWFARPRPALPVVVLLHGTPGDPDDWIDGGRAQETADRWAAAHRGVAPVLLMPDVNGTLDADTECVDSAFGRVETYLVQDVVAFARAALGVRPPGRDWAVAGLSEGGSCALMLALRHPRTFGSFADYSGLAGPRLGETNADTAPTIAALFGGSPEAFAAHEPSVLLGSRRFPGLGGWFEVGDADPEPLAAQTALVPLAQRAGVATCARTVPGGGHAFDVFATAFADSLPWLVARTDPAGGGGSCPPAPAP
jgi:S-formylglutathione hydrolase FrmB